MKRVVPNPTVSHIKLRAMFFLNEISRAMLYGGGEMLLPKHLMVISCCFSSNAAENACATKSVMTG
jgi:hypothetical protein